MMTTVYEAIVAAFASGLVAGIGIGYALRVQRRARTTGEVIDLTLFR